MQKLKLSFTIFFILFFLIISFSSLLNLYEKKDAIKFKVFKLLNISEHNADAYEAHVSDEDEYWANKIMEGGYILHFRHAERDKWIDNLLRGKAILSKTLYRIKALGFSYKKFEFRDVILINDQ